MCKYLVGNYSIYIFITARIKYSNYYYKILKYKVQLIKKYVCVETQDNLTLILFS